MRLPLLAFGLLAFTLSTGVARAEILAMVNYETKSPESLQSLSLTAAPQREEGIAIIDVDPDSDAFGSVLMHIPLPGDLVAHHIFYDRTMTRAYITALGKSELRVMDLKQFPYRIRTIEVPQCVAGEDVILSEDNTAWYLTCMGSSTVVVGDVATDEITATIELETPYPHGLAVHQGIDRILVTSTVRHTDLGDAGEYVTVIEASTNRVLGRHRVSDKPSPAGEAPVEILFIPRSDPPVAYVTNMFGATLWTLTWNPATADFDAAKAFDFSALGAGVALEMYFNDAADRMYVTTATPGHMHIFDIGENAVQPKLLNSIATAEGAHHVAFTTDGRYAFVQNTLLNLPGMSEGSITVVDMRTEKVVASVNTLRDAGYNPNSIVLLPEWNDFAGH